MKYSLLFFLLFIFCIKTTAQSKKMLQCYYAIDSVVNYIDTLSYEKQFQKGIRIERYSNFTVLQQLREIYDNKMTTPTRDSIAIYMMQKTSKKPSFLFNHFVYDDLKYYLKDSKYKSDIFSKLIELTDYSNGYSTEDDDLYDMEFFFNKSYFFEDLDSLWNFKTKQKLEEVVKNGYTEKRKLIFDDMINYFEYLQLGNLHDIQQHCKYLRINPKIYLDSIKTSFRKEVREKVSNYHPLETSYLLTGWLNMQEMVPFFQKLLETNKNIPQLIIKMALIRMGKKIYERDIINDRKYGKSLKAMCYANSQLGIEKCLFKMIEDTSKTYLCDLGVFYKPQNLTPQKSKEWEDNYTNYHTPIPLVYNHIAKMQKYLINFPKLMVFNNFIYFNEPCSYSQINKNIIEKARKWVVENKGKYNFDFKNTNLMGRLFNGSLQE